MRKGRLVKGLLCVLCLTALGPAVGWAAAPIVSSEYATDVTTRSFSVICTADQASVADIMVYQDVAGTLEVAGYNKDIQPVHCGVAALQDAGEDLGILRVQVTGLAAETDYYYRLAVTSRATAETSSFPPPGEDPIHVRTESLTVRSDAANLSISNDVIISDWTLADGTTPADGTVVFASVTGGSHPITAVVGDCAPSGSALIDLNNIFDDTSHESLDLSQGVNLNLVNFRGTDGAAQIVHEVPAEALLNNTTVAAIKNPDPALKSGWNMLSMQVEPDVSDTAAVLAPLNGDVNSIWEYSPINDAWRQFDFTLPPELLFLNDLQNLHSPDGYWLNIVADHSLGIVGQMPAAGPVTLNEGWNLVGPSQLEATLTQSAFGSGCTINSVWNYDTGTDSWRQFDFTLPPALWSLNDLEYIEPGKAYWLDAAGSCVWQ